MLDFIIIGGGLCGLAAARALLSLNYSVLVLEKKSEEFMNGNGAGLLLVAEALSSLKKIGVDTKLFDAHFVHTKSLTSVTKEGTVLEKCTNVNRVTAAWTGMYQVLFSTLPSDTVKYNTKVKQVHSNTEQNCAVVALADGTAMHAKCAIIADGIGSEIRSMVIPHAELKYTGIVLFRGLVPCTSEITKQVDSYFPGFRDNVYIEYAPDRHTGMYYLPDGRLNWWMYITAPEYKYEYLSKTPETEEIEHLFNIAKPLLSNGLEYVINQTENFLINVICDMQPLDKLVYGHSLFLGDAAHPMTPNCGLAANSALFDVCVLYDCLKQKSNIMQGLALYEQIRVPQLHQIVLASRATGYERQSALAPSNKQVFDHNYKQAHAAFASHLK